MSYGVTLEEIDIKIDKKHFPDIIKDLREAVINKQFEERYLTPQPEILKPDCDFTKVFEEFRWTPEFDLDGNIDNFEFYEYNLGNEDVFFNILGPYVEKNSYVRMRGDDGLHWEYQFNGNKMEEITGILDFESSSEIIQAILKKKDMLPLLMGIHNKLDERIAETLAKEE